MSKAFFFGFITVGWAIVCFGCYLYGKQVGSYEMKELVLQELAKYQDKKGDSAIVANFPLIELDSCHNLTLHWQIMKDCDSIRGKNNILTYFKKDGHVITINPQGDTISNLYGNVRMR